jgi:protein phosphatase
MGGARAGEVASRIAVEQFDADNGADDTPEEQLAEVARGANRKIHRMAQEDSAYAGMGTTFTAALVTGKHIAIGHVGDSRLYRFRDGELERLTHDHSLVEEFVRQGKLTPAEAEVHPQRSIITRALGPEPEVEVDTYTHSGRDGDVYLLNSDGLTGMINEETVADILRDRESLEDAAEKLIAAANANGGKDNITVVLFRLGSDGEDEEEDEEPGTLGGQATQVGVSAETVRREVERAERTKAREVPEEEDTLHIAAERATKARTKVVEEKSEPRRSSVQRAPPARATKPKRRKRRYVTAVIVLVVLAAVIAGLYALDRKFWFVGTNDRGQVTLYRGLPYELPFGIDLYSEEYQSAVPVLAVSDARQRKYVLDHHARSEGDSRALVRDIERKFARP